MSTPNSVAVGTAGVGRRHAYNAYRSQSSKDSPWPPLPAPDDQVVTAAIAVIGNEILSGSVQDENIAYIARGLNEIGIQLREVRVVPDIHQEIADAVNVLRRRWDYVFTTGGIGPTQ